MHEDASHQAQLLPLLSRRADGIWQQATTGRILLGQLLPDTAILHMLLPTRNNRPEKSPPMFGKYPLQTDAIVDYIRSFMTLYLLVQGAAPSQASSGSAPAQEAASQPEPASQKVAGEGRYRRRQAPGQQQPAQPSGSGDAFKPGAWKPGT